MICENPSHTHAVSKCVKPFEDKAVGAEPQDEEAPTVRSSPKRKRQKSFGCSSQCFASPRLEVS